MANIKYNLFLALACQLVVAGYVLSQQPPNVVSFGDFIEFDVGLHKACENVAGGPNATWGIIKSFAECTHTLSAAPPQDNFEGLTVICQNKAKYLGCWDQMRDGVSKVCGSDKVTSLPAVYRATVTAFCGSDNGAQKIDNLKKAFAEIEPNAEANCPEETGIHWIENCKALLPTMNSPDLCARHGAINNCLQKITCDNVKFAKLMRQMYTDGGPQLQCNAA